MRQQRPRVFQSLGVVGAFRSQYTPSGQTQTNELDQLLKKTEQAQRNLYAAIEQGLPFDEPLQKRVQELKAERESLLVERASAYNHHAVPFERILPSDIDAFAKAIKDKLSNKDFAKRDLHALVDEITVSRNAATEKR